MTPKQRFIYMIGPFIGLSSAFTAAEDLEYGTAVRAEDGTVRAVDWPYANAGAYQDASRGAQVQVALFDGSLTTDPAWAIEKARRAMVRAAFVAAYDDSETALQHYNNLRTSPIEELREVAYVMRDSVT